MPARKPTKPARAAGRSHASKSLRRGGRNADKPVARTKPADRKGQQTIGGYLIQRLQDYGVSDVFGIPGDFVLQFYGMLSDSPIRVVGTARLFSRRPLKIPFLRCGEIRLGNMPAFQDRPRGFPSFPIRCVRDHPE